MIYNTTIIATSSMTKYWISKKFEAPMYNGYKISEGKLGSTGGVAG